ncbi:aldehyde ferredoxin oxidoreductase C-terminal domain-containing protein [Thermodesulfobacteriota bacterium]
MSNVYRINTQTGNISDEKLKEEYRFWGNRGLVAKVMNDEVNPKCEPLGPENKLIVCTGILAGTGVSTANRVSVGGKSPLTGTIKEANVGGNVGTFLAQHDIKMLIFENEPTDSKWHLFKIDKNGHVELIPADNYIGLNNYALVEKLYGVYGKDIGVLSIGVAGERKYRNSTLQATDFSTGHPARAAARGGLGAVLGAKHIKAVIIEKPAQKHEVIYADKERFTNANKKFTETLIKASKESKEIGTIRIVDETAPKARMPVRNFSGELFDTERIKKINSKGYLKKQKENNGKTGLPCQAGCVVQCSNVYNNSKGDFVTSGLEYETVVLCGPNCDIDNLDYIAEVDKLCDDIGIDTIETGATIAVCMEAGRIHWGDEKAALGLIKEMRDGTKFGQLLGQGTEVVGKKLRVKRIPTVKGQSMAAYEPRNMKGMGVTYATNAMGADHTTGPVMVPGMDLSHKAGQIALSTTFQNMMAMVDNFICLFALAGTMRDTTILPDMMAGVFGGEWNISKINEIGIQTRNMERQFNTAAGFTIQDNCLPDFFYTEPSPATGSKFDLSIEEMAQVFK